MNKFLKRILLFVIPIIIYIILSVAILPDLLVYTEGPNTKQQIETSFKNVLYKDFDLLIIGNSRIYRGVNPDMFFIPSYNFSHDDDSYNQIYYKLKYLEKNNISYHYLVLGVDYFQFSYKSDSRNYVYGKLLGSDYLNDFNSNIFSLKFAQYKTVINPKTLLRLRPGKPVPVLKENGQYIRNRKASLHDKVERDINRLPFQVDYFNRIIDYFNKNNIKLFLVMLPTRKNELDCYDKNQIEEFDSFITNQLFEKNCVFWNFSLDSSYSIDNYTDITHFNSETADRFSLQLSDSIKNYIRQTSRDTDMNLKRLE